jgi:hypothetical protein
MDYKNLIYLSLRNKLVNLFLLSFSTYSCGNAPRPNALPSSFAKDAQAKADELSESSGACGTQGATPSSAALKLTGDSNGGNAGKVINSTPRPPQNPSTSQPSGAAGGGGSNDPAANGNDQSPDKGPASNTTADQVSRAFGQDRCASLGSIRAEALTTRK